MPEEEEIDKYVCFEINALGVYFTLSCTSYYNDFHVYYLLHCWWKKYDFWIDGNVL